MVKPEQLMFFFYSYWIVRKKVEVICHSVKWLRSCKVFKVHLRPPKLFKTIQGSYSLVFSRKVLKSASQFSRPGKCVQNKDDEVRENGLETVVDIA